MQLALLLAECVQHGLRTIAFCKTRKLCELVAAYTREVLAATTEGQGGAHAHEGAHGGGDSSGAAGPAGVVPLALADRLKVYRAGYSPEERRAMEVRRGHILSYLHTLLRCGAVPRAAVCDVLCEPSSCRRRPVFVPRLCCCCPRGSLLVLHATFLVLPPRLPARPPFPPIHRA